MATARNGGYMSQVPEPNAFSIIDEVVLCAQAGRISEERVRELADFATERDEPLVEVLVSRGQVNEVELLRELAKQLHYGFIEGEITQIEGEILGELSPALAISHHVMPIGKEDGRLQLACSDPFDWRKWDELCQVIGKPLDRVLCPKQAIQRMLKASYGIGADTVERIVADREQNEVEVRGLTRTNLTEEEAANEPTVVNLLNKLLAEAIHAKATDIHFEPYESKYRVRYRIDGMLEDVSVPVSVNLLKLALVSRIKIMSNLDITEKRLPQDGRCQVTLGGHDYDMRVSILPGVYGEAVVIRVQSRGMVQLDLEALGYEKAEQERINSLITRPNGLVLVTGPTGSGKTTTLYTCLTKINTPELKIITIEDPVEYWMENILQMQVHEEISFTFANALRGVLRHDPDVVLVGEVRDRETADIAIRASLTGHLVFATLHTNDAPSAVSRLLDLGLESFLLASSLRGIIAQRLLRKVCDHCKEPHSLAELEPHVSHLIEGKTGWDDVTFYRGTGCEHCRFTGYRGRTAIAELMLVSPEIRRMVQQCAPSDDLKVTALKEGMNSLMQSGLQAVRSGRTTMSEVYRVTQEDSV